MTTQKVARGLARALPILKASMAAFFNNSSILLSPTATIQKDFFDLNQTKLKRIVE